MEMMSVLKGSLSKATQTNDPEDHLCEMLRAHTASLPEDAPLDFAACAAALEFAHSAHEGSDTQEVFLNELKPHVFSTMDVQNDVLTHSQMMRVPDRDCFMKAQQPEIDGLHQKRVF